MARVIAVLSLLMLAFASSAHAQDKGQAGLVIGYPASIGIVWHVSENIAIRPDVSFSRSSNDSTNFNTFTLSTTTTTVTSASSGTAWSTSVGLSALFYVHRWESLRVYVSPRFAYGRASSKTTNEPTSVLASTISVTDNISATYTGVGSLGVQYLLGKKFSVFGEVGAAYADAETSTRFTGGGHFEATTKSVSSRSGVGVVIYF